MLQSISNSKEKAILPNSGAVFEIFSLKQLILPTKHLVQINKYVTPGKDSWK